MFHFFLFLQKPAFFEKTSQTQKPAFFWKIEFFGKKNVTTLKQQNTKQQMSLTPENESQMEYFTRLKREIQSMETQIKNAKSEANDKIKILQNTDEYKQLLETCQTQIRRFGKNMVFCKFITKYLICKIR